MPNLTDVLEEEDRQTIRNMIYGYKNLIINGDKRANQRNYTDGVLSNGFYGYDRWKGADSDVNIEQIIEQQNINSGTYAISWVGGGTATVAGVGSLSSGDSTTITVSGNISVKVPKAATNIQLEEGLKATPFEQRPIALELALCQRYLPFILDDATTDQVIASGHANTTTNVIFQIPIKEDMRVKPTSVSWSGSFVVISSIGSLGVSNITINANCTDKNLLINCAVTGATANESYILRASADANATIAIGMEL